MPLLTPRLSSHWIQLVTPLSHRIARPLAEGLKNEVICRDERITRLIPQTRLDVREAIHASLSQVKAPLVEDPLDLLRYGDALDLWRVVGIERDRTLSLRAEMRLPGQALLDLRVDPDGDSKCTLCQTAFFEPRGLAGCSIGTPSCRSTAWSFGRCSPAFSETPSRSPPSQDLEPDPARRVEHLESDVRHAFPIGPRADLPSMPD